jgi:putative membrane protein
MILIRWFLNTLVLIITAYLVPGIYFATPWSALMTSLIFGLVNSVIRPIMIILTLPINIVTLGLFTLIINALMFWLTSTIVKGFEVTNFSAAFWGALVYWIIITLINYAFGDKPKVVKVRSK